MISHNTAKIIAAGLLLFDLIGLLAINSYFVYGPATIVQSANTFPPPPLSNAVQYSNATIHCTLSPAYCELSQPAKASDILIASFGCPGADRADISSPQGISWSLVKTAYNASVYYASGVSGDVAINISNCQSTPTGISLLEVAGVKISR